MRPSTLVLLGSAFLFKAVAGWGFLPPTVITEGAIASFEVTNTDGGGYAFPYTMTVFKHVNLANSSDAQVGLVYTNDTVFYWLCNQPAGTSVKFRLTSRYNVNAATTGFMLVQPGAEAIASSISTLFVASTASKTQTTLPTFTAVDYGNENGQVSAKNIPVGAIVGAIIGGIALSAVLVTTVILVRDRNQRNNAPEMIQHGSVTPFLYGQPPSQQQHIPPLGYVLHPGPNEEPPQYSPNYTQTTSYFMRAEPLGVAGDGATVAQANSAPRNGKSRRSGGGV